jgi:hypothetical protein
MSEHVRSQIQTDKILKRLRDHVDGKVALEATQIKAAEILLRKSLPDLSSVEMVADVEVTTQRAPAELEALAKHLKVPIEILYGKAPRK